MLFRKFDVQGPSDRTLLYLTLYINACLKRECRRARAPRESPNPSIARSLARSFPAQSARITLTTLATHFPTFRSHAGTAASKTKDEAKKTLAALGAEPFKIPGDPGFALGGFLFAPKARDEGELLRGYLRQCREEINLRLIDFCFRKDGTPDKFWFAFAKKTFMNKNL